MTDQAKQKDSGSASGSPAGSIADALRTQARSEEKYSMHGNAAVLDMAAWMLEQAESDMRCNDPGNAERIFGSEQ